MAFRIEVDAVSLQDVEDFEIESGVEVSCLMVFLAASFGVVSAFGAKS